MSPADDLPFTCPSCGLPFGLGEGAWVLGVFAQVPIRKQPTPCCGALITGFATRDAWGRVTLTIADWDHPLWRQAAADVAAVERYATVVRYESGGTGD